MTTRRDIIKLASALGFAGAVPTAAERIAAAQILDQETSSRAMLDPHQFAREIGLEMGNANEVFSNDWYGVVCPEMHAKYAQARVVVDQVLADNGINAYHEIGDYDGATFDFAMAMYDAGVRHGSAYEHLRRSVVGETVQCTECWGTGLQKDADHKRLQGTVCPTCGGTGTVAMKG